MSELWDRSRLVQVVTNESEVSKALLQQSKPYEDQLSGIFPDWKGFLCPICLVHYCDSTKARMLSRAHIWPDDKSCLTTILCKKCNNTIGSKYEAGFLDVEEASVNKRLGRRRERLIVKGDNIEANLECAYYDETDAGRGKLKLAVNDRDCSENTRANFHEIMNGMDGGSVILHFSHTYPSIRKHQIGHLAIAFLAMFRHYGYEFALTQLADSMRKVIWFDEIESPIHIVDIEMDTESELVPWIADDQSAGVGFMIPLKTFRETKQYFILPPLDRDYSDIPISDFHGNARVIGDFEENRAKTKFAMPMWRQFYGRQLVKMDLQYIRIKDG